ncbi:MAG TPA: M23 family metallopeptidase [Candidatus Nanopelagicales bacterium]|nr:M23 family metallopeptidase [Candidatus Nanopelagicales bacterium]
MALRRTGLAAGIAVLLLSVAVPPASALPPAADPPPKVGSDDVASADRVVSAAASTLARARRDLGPARDAARTAAAALRQARTARADARTALAQSRAGAVAAQGRADAARHRYQATRTEVGAVAAQIYMQGPYSELDAVLGASDPGDFAERLAAVRTVGRYYDRTLTDLTAARAELALRRAQATAALARAADRAGQAAEATAQARRSRSSATAARDTVVRLVADRADALAAAQSRRARVKAQYEQYERYQQQVAEATRRAAQRAHDGAGSGGGGGTPSGSGTLQWPIPGAGTSGGVGWRVHPVYGYKSCHTGVDIRGWSGTPIHAAAAGTVLSVINGGAYGLHTVISHAGGLATMYAHQSRTAVRAGQQVGAGQVIGYVGSSGWATGPHLHFEVHVGGVPYDPMGWFGGSRHPVPCLSG